MREPNVPAILVVALFVGLSSPCTAAAISPERIVTDTPKTTVAGNTFIAPAGWSLIVRGPATILEVPEGESFIALIDFAATDAATADAAVAAAWATYKPDAKWPLKVTTPAADKDGWTDRKASAFPERARE